MQYNAQFSKKKSDPLTACRLLFWIVFHLLKFWVENWDERGETLQSHVMSFSNYLDPTHWQPVASYFELFSAGMKEVKLYNHMSCHFQTILIPPPIDSLLPPILNGCPPYFLFLFYFFYSGQGQGIFTVSSLVVYLLRALCRAWFYFFFIYFFCFE